MDSTEFFARVATALLSVLVAVLLSEFFLIHQAKAAPPTVQVDVEPDTLQFPVEGGTEQGVVILRNTSEETLRNVRLDCLASACFPNIDSTSSTDSGQPSLKKQIDGEQGKDLAPNGERVWTVQVIRQGAVTVPSHLNLRVDYDWQEEEGTESVSRVVTTAFGLQVREPDSIEQLADVTVATSLESLNAQRQGKVYLVVTNNSNIPITAKDVSVNGPDFISAKAQPLGEGLSLQPKQSRAINIDVTATDPVQPGKHLLVFTMPFEWTKAGLSYSGSIVKTQLVDVSVLGEPELIKLLGIPSFLFLPGFLAIAMVGLIFNIWNRPEKDRVPKLLEKDFWALAITFSILAAWSYPWILKYIFREEPRYYIESYGLVDLLRMWFISVLVGILFCVVFIIIKRPKTPDPPVTKTPDPPATKTPPGSKQ